MAKILITTLCVLLSCIGSGCSKQRKYQQYLDKLNEKLPQYADDIRVDRMEVDEDTFKCYNTILADMPPPAEQEIVQARLHLLQTVKADSAFAVFRQDELYICFLYTNKQGDNVLKLKINPGEYK